MPTNLVPKNTGSGSLGTDAKRWESINAITGSINHINPLLNTLYVRGNITASGGIKADSFQSVTGGTGIDFNDDLTVSGYISAGGKITADTNTKIGNPFSGFNYAGFANANHLTSTGYALLQTPTGETILNAETNKRIIFRIGNTGGGTALDEMVLTSGSLAVHCSISSSGGISANHITASGNISASGDLWINNITASGNITATGTGSFGPVSASNSIKVNGNNPYFLAQESATEFLKMGVSWTPGNIMIGWDDSDDLYFGTMYQAHQSYVNTKMMISASGNVGIGTTNPLYKLSVAGDISASGDLYVNDISMSGYIAGVSTISASGMIQAAGIIKTKRYGKDIVKLHRYADKGIVSVYQSGTEVIKLDGTTGNISASGNLTVDGNITASKGMFSDLPTSIYPDSTTGILYTQLGSQLGLGSITGSIANKKFVLVA